MLGMVEHLRFGNTYLQKFSAECCMKLSAAKKLHTQSSYETFYSTLLFDFALKT